MKAAVCPLLVAALLPLPAVWAQDAGTAASMPAATTQAAAAPTQMAPASAPAAAPIPSGAASAPEQAPPASAPGRAARRKSASRLARTPAPEAASRHARATGRKQNADPGTAQAALNDVDPDRNPVIEAINLVANTQRDEIKAADRRVANADWWMDALDREWIVRRPFGPGLFDSTHWFYVSYKVNGRVLMSWFVDLAKGTVSPTTPPDRQEPQK